MFFKEHAAASKRYQCVTASERKRAPIFLGAIALSYPPRVRVRATVKLSAAFFHDESSITIGGGGGYESAIAPFFVWWLLLETFQCFLINMRLLLKDINERLLLKEKKMCFLELCPLKKLF